MAKFNIYAKQIPQVSATGNDGELNIHLKCWYFAETLADIAFNHVDDCGMIDTERTVRFDTSNTHLMNVLKNKEITHYQLVNGQQFPISF